MDEPALRTVLRNLVLPPIGPLLLIIAGMALSRSRRFGRAGLALAITGAAVLWCLSTPAFSGWLVRAVELPAALDLSRPLAADVVVILGGGVRRDAPEYGGPAPSQVTLQRLAYGARVARVSGLPLLVTGRDDEADAMADVLARDFGLRPRWVERQARNTRENAAHSAQLLSGAHLDTVVLVTSALHMRRAAAEFEAQGLRVIVAPADVPGPHSPRLLDFAPGLGALRESHYALYELLGRLVARATSAH